MHPIFFYGLLGRKGKVFSLHYVMLGSRWCSDVKNGAGQNIETICLWLVWHENVGHSELLVRVTVKSNERASRKVICSWHLDWKTPNIMNMYVYCMSAALHCLTGECVAEVLIFFGGGLVGLVALTVWNHKRQWVLNTLLKTWSWNNASLLGFETSQDTSHPEVDPCHLLNKMHSINLPPCEFWVYVAFYNTTF